MAILYKYKVVHLTSAPSLNGLSDVITCAGFVYTGTDEETGFNASIEGTVEIPEPDAESFTPLGIITEDDIIGWIKEIQSETEMNEEIDAKIQAQIDAMTPQTEVPEPLK